MARKITFVQHMIVEYKDVPIPDNLSSPQDIIDYVKNHTQEMNDYIVHTQRLHKGSNDFMIHVQSDVPHYEFEPKEYHINMHDGYAHPYVLRFGSNGVSISG